MDAVASLQSKRFFWGGCSSIRLVPEFSDSIDPLGLLLEHLQHQPVPHGQKAMAMQRCNTFVVLLTTSKNNEQFPPDIAIVDYLTQLPAQSP